MTSTDFLVASSSPIGSVLLPIIVVVVAILGVRRIRALGPPTVQFQIASPPHEVVSKAIAQLARKRHWRVQGQTADSATFSVKRMNWMHWVTGLFLMVFLIIPGVVYLYVQSRREDTLIVRASPDPAGASVQISANGMGARMALRPLRSALGG